MQFKMEQLEYQEKAIESVLKVFEGQEKNTFENSYMFNIYSNQCSLSKKILRNNIEKVITENGINPEQSNVSDDRDLCIEMETGTGKTLVYIKTIYELYQKYGFTKFIILVPSIAIKEGVLKTLKMFEQELGELYNQPIDFFEYESNKISKLKQFIGYDTPQIMISTIQSFSTDDRILNQEMRDDSIQGLSYLQALGKTNPIVIMDEPQEGMGTENAVERLKTLDPLFKIRYSATHKVIKNLIYQLTPYDAYQQGLVKKIEVLTVAEKNDEASLKIVLSQVSPQQNKSLKVKFTLWRQQGDKFVWKETAFLQVGDNLGTKSNNIIYKDYTIKQIYKNLEDEKFYVSFTNGIEVEEKAKTADISGIFRAQLKWLIKTHFKKKTKLKELGIKPLSLIFIDRVDNYMNDNGIIKIIFEEEYKKYLIEELDIEPTQEDVKKVQGYYFAKTTTKNYTDNVNSIKKNKQIYDLILKDKEKLLSFDNKVEFIFSHSALGVGWDNPNVFNIATLNQSYNENKKRQEIGRGLRISVNQEGKRVYDLPETNEGDEINILTIVPNETYEVFAEQYQEQIKEAYGDKKLGSKLRNNHKGNIKNKKTVKRNNEIYKSKEFEEFFNSLRQKTTFNVKFNENSIIETAVDKINNINISKYQAEIVLNKIRSIDENQMHSEELGRTTSDLKAIFSSTDIVKELSENTNLSYRTTISILKKIKNYNQLVTNPPLFINEASKIMKNIILDEMVRSIEYTSTNERFKIEQFKENIDTYQNTTVTPNRGLYDEVIYDSLVEKEFAIDADIDGQVVCFVKFPSFYVIPTPIGNYNPDWGIVLKKNVLGENSIDKEMYFVIETKSTNDINDKNLTEAEKYKIKCAIKHFNALGIDTQAKYLAPVNNYQKDFKDEVNLKE